MTVLATLLVLAPLLVILAIRHTVAARRAHLAAARRLGISRVPAHDRNPISEILRLNELQQGIELRLEAGLIDDDEARYWHRVATNRFRLLLISVVLAGFPIIAGAMSDFLERQGPRPPSALMTLIGFGTWLVSFSVAAVVLRRDKEVSIYRLLGIVGTVVSVGGLALGGATIFR